MTNRVSVKLMAVLLAAAAIGTPVSAGAPRPSDGQRALAKRLAGADFAHLYRNFCSIESDIADRASDAMPATRVFDNLVFLGRRKWDSWALLTSDGIILFDALETNAEAERHIIGGLRSLGLDPATIKYVVVMHGHGDHFGGAKLLHDRFGARVMMSEADWGIVAETVAATAKAGIGGRSNINGRDVMALRPDQPAPEKDLVITDGMTLTLGDTSVRLYLTPGHTPGTASALLPLRDGNRRYTGAYWGGTGFDAKRNDLTQYIASIDRFSAIARRANAEVALTNHPTNDVTALRLPLLATRKPGARHPFVIGGAAYGRLLGVLRACVNAAWLDANPKQRGG